MVGVSVVGSIGELASLGTRVAIKKDWVVVLTHSDTGRLAVVNAIMRGIDLLCEICAPMAFGVVLAATGVGNALLFVAVWNALSFFPELYLLLRVYRASPLLRRRPGQVTVELDGAQPDEASPAAAPPARARSFAARWRVYVRQAVLLSSQAYCLLYLTVLQPSYLLTAYLESQGVNEVALAGFRAVSAVVGLAATLLVPVLLNRDGVTVEGLGMFAVCMQFVVLLPCAIAVFIPDATP